MMRTSNQESLFLKDVNPVKRYRCLHSGKILLALLRRPAVQLTLWLGQHVVGPTCSLGTSQEVCSHEGRRVGLPSSLVLPTAALETLQYLASSLVAVMIIELPQTINRRFIVFFCKVPRKPKAGSRLPKKGAILRKPIQLKSYGTVSPRLSHFLHAIDTSCTCWTSGCFGSTFKANENFLSLRGSRVCVCLRFTWIQNHDYILSSVSNKNEKSFHIDTKDFATQIYWSRDYTQKCKSLGLKKSAYCRPETAEFFAGMFIAVQSVSTLHSLRCSCRYQKNTFIYIYI